jgi:hypothetical protein
MLLAVLVIIVLVVYLVYDDLMKEARQMRHRVALIKLENERDEARRQVKSLKEQLAERTKKSHLYRMKG